MDGRRGGGVAIAFSEEKFHVSKLNIEVKPLECMFALIKPKNPGGKTKKIIAICFYSPPRSKSNNKLIECRQIRRQRDHAYQRGGKSPTYFRIQADFQTKLLNQANKYKEKIITEVNCGKRGSG